jgi:putative membrane protein
MDKTVSNTARISRLGALIVATVVLGAGAAGPALAAPNAPAASPLDDAQIAHRVVAFNRAEVKTAASIKERISSPAVWQLAQRMTVEDAAFNQRFGSLAVAVLQSSSDGDGVADGQAADSDLSRLSGDALARAYVDREVKAHQTMLGALDGQLIPSAKNEELRNRLIDLRAETVAHLQHAEEVQHDQKVRELMAQQPDFTWVP